MTDTKDCAMCRKILPIDDFPLNRRRKDGHGDYCISCARVLCARSYAKRKGQNVRQLPMFAAKKDTCTCGDFARCMTCRNQEKRRAWRENRAPAYLTKQLSRLSPAGM